MNKDLSQVAPNGKPDFHLRSMIPTDRDWIVDQHEELYKSMFGWGADFRATVADICDELLSDCDFVDEYGWVAEMGEEPAGCIALCRRCGEEAQLRILLVHPKARGLGIGRKLVEECVSFARQRNYKRILLRTNGELAGARRLYEEAGFRPIQAEEVEQFGSHWISEIWRLDL